MRIYVATSNAGKLRDFGYAAECAGSGVEIVPLPGLGGIPAPAEDEATFEGNARAKALGYARAAAQDMRGELVLADDSGLEVRCLEGAPGVRSARYAEDEGFPHAAAASVDERNNAALLRALDGVPAACRQARYRCVLALARCGDEAEVVAVSEGVLEGVVVTAPRGQDGFGYDPLFFVPAVGKTMAEVDVAARLELSHRGRALRKLLESLSCRL